MQLRDLVPPQSSMISPADKDDSKRPKHVVLSDTIALVKELQVKVRCYMSSWRRTVGIPLLLFIVLISFMLCRPASLTRIPKHLQPAGGRMLGTSCFAATRSEVSRGKSLMHSPSCGHSLCVVHGLLVSIGRPALSCSHNSKAACTKKMPTFN